MNKLEAINEIKKLDTTFKSITGRWLPFHGVLDIFNQINEPKKVKIPRFVADYLEQQKQRGEKLFDALFAAGNETMQDWLNMNNNEEIFARAWLDGYEVEQEKKYTVRSGKSYFSKFDEVRAVAVLDDMPGYEDYVKYFDSLEEALEVAGQLGWEVEEVEW